MRDRISVSELSDACPKTHPDPRKLLPSQEDIESIRKDVCILISRLVLRHKLFFRIIVDHMDEFKDQIKNVVKHIPSKHKKDMEKKNDVVHQNTIC